MEDLKLPIALVIAMVAQIVGGVWWVSKQTATLEDLKENIARNTEEVAELWKSVDSVNSDMTRQIEVRGRLYALEREMQFFDRDRFKNLGHDPNAR